MRGNKGYTLIEVIVAMAILGGVMVPMVSYLYNNVKIRETSHEYYAQQLLKREMNRVILSGEWRSRRIRHKMEGGKQFLIRYKVRQHLEEKCLFASIHDMKKKELAEYVYCDYE